MIRNRQNGIIRWVLHLYVHRIVNRHFHDLVSEPVEIDPNKSILLLANHFSYWDSLILYMTGRKVFQKRFHVMVREDTAGRFHFIKYGGAFSVSKRSRDMLESLNYAAALLHDPQNLVLIFPQGKLYANFAERINFEKGVMKVISAAEGKFQLVFAATFVQYLKQKKPTATVYLQNEGYTGETLAELENAYQQFFESKKAEQTAISL